MENPAQNHYTPDQVPVETPFVPEELTGKKGKTDYTSTFMVLGIIIFVVIIFVEAYFLVQKGGFTPTQTPAYSGPSLQQ